ncbi:NAD-specific glutamate dehydrogenase, large form [[Actinomadura] parvosata subsp. kistnae]|uniref:NAD-glutamate dehydrogenase n=1 Tax=[Actinomadura] parvosata subsp. kistnae TaxID=1909395 RepID=A0A1V0A8P0_9ACTN|nr:NAD-glutamate dehydrogenase [Nonomuraea sp. ATCC 55076]AQZ66543.1 NAD-glutamate dehydrogenase [Nonomuraea sp. ATCC 55076]SPL95388.1 NAD-specific glutamate dehydrogenase, large form [Actinomadura parvosata subsp. kistnae]
MPLDEAKDELLQRAAESCAVGSEHVSPEEALSFLRFYYRHVAPEDLLDRNPVDVYGPAMSQRQLAEVRPQGRAVVRAYTPTLDENGWDPGHSVVEVVTDDMPFLVDSVTMELDRHDLGVHLVVHPQMRVRRDMTGRMLGRGQEDVTGQMLVESWIHIEIDRQSDPAALKEIEADLQRVLTDVRHAVEDFRKMRALAVQTAEDLSMNPPPLEPAEVEDSIDLLRWLADGHFTFLGYREYRLEDTDEGETLRALPGAALGILRDDKVGSGSFAALPAEVRAKAREKQLMIITKANSRATVHRATYLDYIGVKLFSPEGEVIGERRFLGLFTHVAYNESISRIPVLRRKLAGVLGEAGLAPDSHDGKDLIEILETFPRDELFQTSVDQLLPIAMGVLRLRERKQVKLFLRRDDYGRYISCLIYLPRDRYTTKVRLKMQEVLLKALGGRSLDYSAMIGESVLARLHVVVRGERGKPLPPPSVDVEELEARLAALTRSWEDDLAAALTEMTSEEEAPTLIRRYASAFPEGYKADFPPKVAVVDLRRLEQLVEAGDGEQVDINLYEPYDATEGERRLKIYKVGSPISLSQALPLIQRLGVEVVDERPYEIDRDNDPSTKNAWIYDFGLRYTPSEEVDRNDFKRLFQDGLAALWKGRVQDDDFNALILRGGLTWEQVEILRVYAKYLRQAGSTFSQPYMERVLRDNVRVARLLVRLFEAKLDPRRGEDVRVDLVEALNEEILRSLDEVASLDEDRILRAYLEMIQATLRTNYFQTVDGERKPYISLKFDPQAISVLPLPRPKFEIFVYSPRVEGVHLRFGKVARGGLRWSDRMEDFRTEILGLVKAQMVKNTVIVPTGSKGGFVVKRPPKSGSREELLAEGVACYRMFISGLLDITDNLVDGKVVPPPDVVRHDGDDTYLVVAADKGTATFSDIANSVAKEYGFWLGDAFASGGSIGYDHKAMGITARGAWESVRYHFRTMGVDVQTTDFTVAGIGDMSGDVFGNGMLLSEHIRLVAAFDHRHIFVDPSPDAARSFAERQRLFELPRSSWEDYDAKLISAGGGVFPRTAKSIQITPQMREALGIPSGIASMAPNDLISAILKAPVDLLWNGGIGTYVKSTTESHADVGDKANDVLRVNASDLRCKVVGEGGNLGFTQLARIEFALNGGLVNTDFIDNSAGVDTSDHEVNIKILLDQVVRDGELTDKQRNQVFTSMTDEVADLVLRDNYAQNVVLDAARTQAVEMLHIHARYLRKLERDGLVNRELEFLPSDKTLAERRQARLGLTAPEFSVLLAYTKLVADAELLGSDLPDDPYLASWLVSYFPSALRERFRTYMDEHPLRREIITTRVVNELVNSAGTTFMFRFGEETGASTPDIVRAYLVAREVFDLPSFYRAVEELDNQVDTGTQIAMLLEARKLAERGTRWLLVNRRPPLDLAGSVSFFVKGVNGLLAHIPKLVTGPDLAAYEERRDSYVARGVPQELAERVAGMVPAYSTLDLVEIASLTGRPVSEVAEVYFDLADRLQLARLRERVIALPRDNRWNSIARSALRDDLYAAHASLTRDVLAHSKPGLPPEERLARWTEANSAAVARARQTLSEIWESDHFDLATLSVALRAIRTLVAASNLPHTEA